MFSSHEHLSTPVVERFEFLPFLPVMVDNGGGNYFVSNSLNINLDLILT